MSSPCFRLLSGTGTPACAGLHEAAGAAGGAKGLLPFLVWEQRESNYEMLFCPPDEVPPSNTLS
jgi:hypothetical protein